MACIPIYAFHYRSFSAGMLVLYLSPTLLYPLTPFAFAECSCHSSSSSRILDLHIPRFAFYYLVSAMLSTGVVNAELTCSSIELVTFDPPSAQTCGEYMSNYISSVGGAILVAFITAKRLV